MVDQLPVLACVDVEYEVFFPLLFNLIYFVPY
jgi:hypothetical protein